MATTRLTAPLPGTFYRRSAPDRPVLKAEGDMVAVGDVIGIIEVMKTFNEVRADAAGRLLRFLVENEDAVMSGQILAELEA